MPRHAAQEAGQVALVAVVPAEVEVAVGAVELRGVGQHAGVGDDGPGAVGVLQGPLHGAVEHRLVPGGELLRGQGTEAHATQGLGVAPHRRVVLDGHRLVVAAPDGDGRVVAEELDRRAGLADGLLAHASGVAPLEREVLPQEQPPLVGGVVQLGAGDVGVDAQQVETGVEGEVDVAGQLGRGGLGQGHAGGPLVRALEEEALAVDRGHPAPHADLAQAGAEPPLVRHGAPPSPSPPSSCSTTRRRGRGGWPRRGPGATTGPVGRP